MVDEESINLAVTGALLNKIMTRNGNRRSSTVKQRLYRKRKRRL